MNEQVIRQIRSVRPDAGAPVSGELRREILEAAFAQPDQDAHPLRRRRRRRMPPVPVAAIAVLGVASVAAAAGLVVTQATRDRSESLSREPANDNGGAGVRGTALHAEIERVRALTPYPPGVVDDPPTQAMQGITIGSVRVVMEERANCYWQSYWISATESGDADGARDAATILRQSADWPTYKTTGGDEHLIALATAELAARGDLAGMKARRASYCRGVFGPR